ncbi:MAG: hypothetical protein WD795_13500 [Woeseia sp.]
MLRGVARQRRVVAEQQVGRDAIFLRPRSFAPQLAVLAACGVKLRRTATAVSTQVRLNRNARAAHDPDKLSRQYPMVKTPAISTVHAVLDRNGLVKRRKRRRHKARGTPLSAAHEPNGLWCADFKGEFMLGIKQYCSWAVSTYCWNFFILPFSIVHTWQAWQSRSLPVCRCFAA